MELDNEIKTLCNEGNILIRLTACDIYSLCLVCLFLNRIPGFNSECNEIASGDPESEVPFSPGEIESIYSVCGRKHGIEEYVNQRTEAEKAAKKQPFLLCTGSLAQQLNFFRVIEGSLVLLGQNSSIAFNVLFRSFFCVVLCFVLTLYPVSSPSSL
jgi:hypothetical protein